MKSRLVPTSFGDIAVHESKKDGPAVILIHGNSLSSESYRHQIDGEPGRRWRLIALDLPGHGASPRAEDAERTYRLGAYAQIVRELGSRFGPAPAVIVGNSLGGHIALEAIGAGLVPRGLLIFGTPPLAYPPDFQAAFRAQPTGALHFRGDLTAVEVAALAGSFMPDGTSPAAYFAKSVSATDPAAREVLGRSTTRDRIVDERATIQSLRAPVAIVAGEFDRLVNIDYLRALHVPALWRGSIQMIPGAGHCPQYDSPESFNKLLGDFLVDLEL